jgi:hypothetical protein
MCLIGNKYLPTIRKIPDELWNEIKLLLPPEKPNDTTGRSIIRLEKFWMEFYMY